jgi:cell division protein FtsB
VTATILAVAVVTTAAIALAVATTLRRAVDTLAWTVSRQANTIAAQAAEITASAARRESLARDVAWYADAVTANAGVTAPYEADTVSIPGGAA